MIPECTNQLLQLTPALLRVKELEEQNVALRNSVICAFNQLLDLKDLNTGVHSTRLAEKYSQTPARDNQTGSPTRTALTSICNLSAHSVPKPYLP